MSADEVRARMQAVIDSLNSKYALPSCMLLRCAATGWAGVYLVEFEMTYGTGYGWYCPACDVHGTSDGFAWSFADPCRALDDARDHAKLRHASL